MFYLFDFKVRVCGKYIDFIKIRSRFLKYCFLKVETCFLR